MLRCRQYSSVLRCGLYYTFRVFSVLVLFEMSGFAAPPNAGALLDIKYRSIGTGCGGPLRRLRSRQEPSRPSRFASIPVRTRIVAATPPPPGDAIPAPEVESVPDASVPSPSASALTRGDLSELQAALRSPDLDEYAEQRAAGLTQPLDVGLDAEFFDVWALAVDSRKAFELKNQYNRVGILLEKNYPDFAPVSEAAGDVIANASIEELSAAKARAVYHATGIPAIAETHELEIEAPESGSRINKTLQQGYKTRDIEGDADAMIDRVRPISDENRMTNFLACVAYYDGENEIVTHGQCSVAIAFSNAQYCTVAVSSALDELYMDLTGRFGLKMAPPGGSAVGADSENNKKNELLVGATLLRERIMREGEMLDDGILKVSSFLNHRVDADLMEACGVELAERLRRQAPTKVLTVESTGLIPGLPTARQLSVPLVFARKSRPITISDSYQTTYRSATKGTSNDLIISCEYLTAGDRVVIIDDFLAGGSTAEALFKLAKMAHAKVVGVGVLIEKMSDGGRAFLSGYNVPVESLAKVIPGSDTGRIDVMEEEPWVAPEDTVDQVDVTTMKIRAARETAAKRLKEGANRGEQGSDEVEDDGEVMSEDDVRKRGTDAVVDDDDDDDLDIIDMMSDEDDFDALEDRITRQGRR